MPILLLFAVIVLIGLVVGLVYRFAPIHDYFKHAILVIGIVCVLIMVLQAFGVWDALTSVRVPSVTGHSR